MDKRVTTGRTSRRKHDEAFKRELVERSLQPGASVAAIAQDSGINANLLFNWRRLYLRRGGSTIATMCPARPTRSCSTCDQLPGALPRSTTVMPGRSRRSR